MSEFSKLAARIDGISDAILKIDSDYGIQHAHSTDSGIGERNHMDISDVVSSLGSVSNQSSAASQSMSTTTSATPDFRSQWAWRSTSSAVATDKDQYLSVEGKQLIIDYDVILKLRDEISSKILPSCEQFVLKAAKDALSDTPRYGTAMRLKITAASEKSQSLSELASQIIERLGPLLELENENKRQRKLYAENEAKEAILRDELLAAAAAAASQLSPAELFLAEEERKSKCKAEVHNVLSNLWCLWCVINITIAIIVTLSLSLLLCRYYCYCVVINIKIGDIFTVLLTLLLCNH